MENKYLWIFVPRWKDGEPFPLFWADEHAKSDIFDNLDEKYQEKIKYVLSDSGIEPDKGSIISWYDLKMLDHESLLPKL